MWGVLHNDLHGGDDLYDGDGNVDGGGHDDACHGFHVPCFKGYVCHCHVASLNALLA